MSSGRTDPGMFEPVAAAAEHIAALPGIATPDWCDVACGALTRLARGSAAALLVGAIEESGLVSAVECAGAAVAADRFIARAHPRPGVEPDRSPIAASLRGAVQALTHLGWAPGPDGLAGPISGPLSSMPGGRAWRTSAAARELQSQFTGDPIVAMSPVGPDRSLAVWLIVPASPANPDDLAVALRPLVAMIARRVGLALGDRPIGPDRWLTTREQLVLEHLARGQTVRQIALTLGRSEHTVHDHIKSMHRKLNAGSRGELIAKALGRPD